MSNAAANPYAVPTANVEDVVADPQAEAIRRAHINHEASIRSVGLLDYLGGALLVIVAAASLVGSSREAWGTASMLVLAALGIALIFAGWGVRALRRWGQITGCVVSVIGLLGFPFGTLINGYILYLLLSKKGRTIFAPEYKDVIAATPHVKYRTSILVWIFLALLVALAALAVLAPLFGK